MPDALSRARSRRARSSAGRSSSAAGSIGEQVARIGDEALVTGAGVGDPEAVDRVVAGAAAQEHDPTSVGRDAHVTRVAERETLGARVLAREGVGHGRHTTRDAAAPIRSAGRRSLERGSTMILACPSGSASSSKAAGTPSISTVPVTSGSEVDRALGDRAEGGRELVRFVTERELDAQLATDAEHRMDPILLHAHPDDEDAGVLGRHPHGLLDHAGHTDRLEDHERAHTVDPPPGVDHPLVAGVDDDVASEVLGEAPPPRREVGADRRGRCHAS